MQMLIDFLKNAYAILAVVPIVPFIVVYAACAAYWQNKKKAFRLAMDVTTFLLIGCVAVLFNELTGSSFGFYGILLILLLSAGLLGNLQVRLKGKLDPRKIVRTVWRLGFFVMGTLYIVLMLVGIGRTFWTI